jgi:molybdenum cofactor synthesis domain-containing protein
MGDLHIEGFRNLTRVDDALRTFFDAINWPSLKTETVDVDEAFGRVLGQVAVSRQFIPSADRSVMDGYAVRSADTTKASEERPVVLEIVGESRTGEVSRVEIEPGQALTVATGGMIPRGADSVVMVEETRSLANRRMAIHRPSVPGQNISKKGEDVTPGAQVLSEGQRLRSQDLGILRALGFARVRVVRRPRIGIISTGNELVAAVGKRDIAKVVDLNRQILSAMSKELGTEPVDLGIVKDDEAAILRVLRKALRSCDVTVITAGSSVGKKDLVPVCINKLGKPGMVVHGIAMRPSLPTGLAVVNGKPVLSLPGFPVSAIIAFRVFGRPLIARLRGSEDPIEPVVKAKLKERVSGPKGYRTFIRVKLSRTPEGLVAEPLKLQRSSVLMSMVEANGIVMIPEEIAGFDAGQQVDVIVIGEIAS